MDRVYSAEQYSNTVSVTDPADNRLLGSIHLGDPTPSSLSPLYKGQLLVHGLGFSPDRRTVDVVSIGSNSVTFIDTATNSVKHITYVGRSPHEAFFTPDSTEVWVTVRGENYVAVLDGATYQPKTRIIVPNGPGMTIFSPDGKYGYVCSSFTPETGMETGTLHFQCRVRRPEGGLLSIVVDGRVYRAEDGTPIRIAGVVTDVTERRRIEEALHQTQRLQTVGTIAAGVAHNFNNLLTIVLGNLDLASRQGSNIERLPLYLAAATMAAERGANLTWQLLAFARLQPLRPEPIEPSRQLRDLSTLIGQAFPPKIAIEIDIPPDLWVVQVDPSELQFTLLNLTFNARDAMPNGGMLRVSATNQAVQDDRLGLAGRYVAIEIADNGCGIPSEILPRVFEPFVTTKEVGAGTGLGLSQVHGFVHQSGGAVDLESEPGRGTTVRVYLPATAKAPTTAETSRGREGGYRAMGTVLVVEDQPDLADLLGELFREWQLEIKVAHRASTALELLREGGKVDLVFSDIMMPGGMDGLELAEVMKKEFPEVPILLTSGYGNVTGNAVARGFQVIPKPYRMEELRMRLGGLLNTRST
jgi:YVTN family beta-propeller protein